MLGYYPLEHLSFLASKEVIPSTYASPISKRKVNLNPGILGLWSVRCWALYVLLQFAHLREDQKLLIMQQRTLKKAKQVNVETETEKLNLAKRWDSFYNELVLNLGNLPLALHW